MYVCVYACVLDTAPGALSSFLFARVNPTLQEIGVRNTLIRLIMYHLPLGGYHPYVRERVSDFRETRAVRRRRRGDR